MNFQADFIRTFHRLSKNSVRAPIDLLEKAAIQFFHPNQIIPAIIGGPDHDSIVCALQLYYRLAKCVGRRGRAI